MPCASLAADGAAVRAGLEPYGLYWFEEPCWPESVAGIAAIQQAVSTPIATGERLIGQHAFRPFLERQACSVLQPDITHCGGLSEARRIAAMAEAYRVALAPHNSQGPVSTAASLELGFATPSYIICESVHGDVPWRQDIVSEGYTIEPRGRIVRPTDRPGLGIEINEAEVKSIRSSRRCCSARFMRMARWEIGETLLDFGFWIFDFRFVPVVG